LSLLYRWDPNSFCHFHRHLCSVTSLVLEGELHVQTFENGERVLDTVRRPGDYAKKPPGDVHMEQGGPEGALVLFELFAPDGQLTQQLDAEGNVLRTLTTQDLQRALAKQHERAAA
jgi:quercetin dioxygenase-like cupin family protein